MYSVVLYWVVYLFLISLIVLAVLLLISLTLQVAEWCVIKFYKIKYGEYFNGE